jgi:hypothetical protein
MLERGGSSTLFSCENWVSLWKEHLISESLLKWENHSLFEIYPLWMKWRNTCMLWNNTMSQRHKCPAHCFPMRIEFPFERNAAYLSWFLNVRNITFMQNSSIQVKGRSSVSFVRKQSMLEAGGSSTLFPCENWVSFWKEYCLPLWVLKHEELHNCAN